MVQLLASTSTQSSRLSKTSSKTNLGRPDGLRRPVSCPAMPSAPVFQPIIDAADLPARAQSYLSLLAESTTSQGAMQKHMLRLACRAAARAAKAVEFLHSPLDAARDNIMDAASELLIKQLAKLRADTKGDAGPVCSSSSSSGGTQAPKAAGWKVLRHAVLGISSFRSCVAAQQRGSQDDSCLSQPQQQQHIHPAHSKVLSLIMSVMVSGPASAMAEALPLPMQSPFGSVADVVASMTHGMPGSTVNPSLAHMNAFQRAPSVRCSSIDSLISSSSSSLATAGGMALPTAMKLLTSDSKRTLIPGFGDIMSTILDTVSDSISDAPRVTQHAVEHRKQQIEQ